MKFAYLRFQLTIGSVVFLVFLELFDLCLSLVLVTSLNRAEFSLLCCISTAVASVGSQLLLYIPLYLIGNI
jgi:hypothetical protein